VHEKIDTIKEVVEIPDHDERHASSEFIRNRKKLIHEMGERCFICGSDEKLEAHHLLEWCFANDFDFNKVKDILLKFDMYGLSEKMKDVEISSVDDIRNLLILCKHHHIEKNNGVHALTFPVWLAQAATKDGIDITPDKESK